MAWTAFLERTDNVRPATVKAVVLYFSHFLKRVRTTSAGKAELLALGLRAVGPTPPPLANDKDEEPHGNYETSSRTVCKS